MEILVGNHPGKEVEQEGHQDAVPLFERCSEEGLDGRPDKGLAAQEGEALERWRGVHKAQSK